MIMEQKRNGLRGVGIARHGMALFALLQALKNLHIMVEMYI